jgi:hypothetical protein
MVQVRIPDIKRFDEKQLLKELHGRGLVPAWVEEIKPLPDMPPAASDVLDNQALKALEGEWRTNEVAPRKFWFRVKEGYLRLHTTRHGFWSAATTPILDAGKDWIQYGSDPAKGLQVKYKMEADALVVEVPAPSVYQGRFKLFRKGSD